MRLLTKCWKVESLIVCNVASQMCEAKRMSPCCDYRIISSGSSRCCMYGNCPYKVFFQTSATDFALASVALLLSILFLCLILTWCSFLLKMLFSHSKNNLSAQNTFMVQCVQSVICKPAHLILSVAQWCRTCVSRHSELMSQRMADYFLFSFQIRHIDVSVCSKT